MRKTTRRKRGGSAVVEVSLLAPWFFLMFAGVLDFGFYAYSLIATENAARVAALYLAADEDAAPADACAYVRAEMNALPNTRDLADCASLPLRLTVEETIEGIPPHIVRTATVAYQTVPLMPIPGLTGRYTAIRSVSMRVK